MVQRYIRDDKRSYGLLYGIRGKELEDKKYKITYLVVGKYKEPEKPRSFFDRLADCMFGGSVKKYIDMNLATFSTKAKAEKYISSGVDIPWPDELENCHIQEWKIDYWE